MLPIRQRHSNELVVIVKDERGESERGDRAWYTLWHCVCFTVHWIAGQTRSPLLLPSLLYVFSSVRRGWWCQSSLGIAKVITFNMKRTAAQPQERGYGMSVCECVYPSLSLTLPVCTCPHKNKCRHFSYFLRLAMDAVECGRERKRGSGGYHASGQHFL